jgi:hypothetical protein
MWRKRTSFSSINTTHTHYSFGKRPYTAHCNCETEEKEKEEGAWDSVDGRGATAADFRDGAVHGDECS